VELVGEDLPCYSNKIQPVSSRKFPHDHQPTDKAGDSRVTNISSKTCTYKMAAKTSWHRYETKLRHCRPMYRVAHNKPDYLLLLSMFCISRTKHVAPNYDNVRVAPRTLVKAVLNVSSTGCNNERQSFTKLSYSAIDNVLTNLLPAGLQDFFQVLSVSNAMMTVNQMLEYPHIDALKTGLFGGHFFGSTNSGT